MTKRLNYIAIIFLTLMSCGSPHKEEEEEDSHHTSHGIVIEPETAKRFGLDFETVRAGKFHSVIKTFGEIEASPTDVYTLTAKKNGIVHLNPGLSVGVAIKKGESIATISSQGLQGGDAIAVARANLETAKSEYDRLKPLFEDRLVSASEFREAERRYKEAQAIAGEAPRGGSAVITSPGEGSLINLNVKTGDYVDVGTPVATVAKTGALTLRADLPSRNARYLEEITTANFLPEGGDTVLSLSTMEGRKVSGAGSVTNNGYIPIYFTFKGTDSFTPGGYAEVFLICGERDGVVSVPRQSLIEIQGNKYVYVKEDDHGYEKRLVITGVNDGSRVEIISGLEENEEIVTNGASIVRMAEVSAIAPPAHTHNH